MKRYPFWKHAMVFLLLLFACVYALPSVYPSTPTIQFRARSGVTISDPVAAIDTALAEANIKPISISHETELVILEFADTEIQLAAKQVIDEKFFGRAVSALATKTTAPTWLGYFKASPLALGLDLKGGAHFLLETDTKFAIDRFFDNTIDATRRQLRSERISVRSLVHTGEQLQINLSKAGDKEQILLLLTNTEPRLTYKFVEDTKIVGEFAFAQRDQLIDLAVGQNVETLRRRVNEIGVSEPVIARQGSIRIIVQLPGLQDTARAKEILGRQAALELRGVVEGGTVARAGSQFIDSSDGAAVLVEDFRVVTGENIIDASYGSDESGRPAVHLALDATGAARMKAYTREHRGEQMAIVLLESGNAEVLSAPQIQSELFSRFIIHGGGMTADEANQLSLLLRSGSLASPLSIVEERTIGPSLGADNIRSGLGSVAGGFALVAILIALYYSVFGAISVAALIANLVCLTALLGVLGAALTLPGLAGFALTLGMAIDANVLINERIREELDTGIRPGLAIEAGYERAFATILDANITTLIAGLTLFALGSGPVRGFAVVLCLGIATSMFSAVVFSRSLVDLSYGHRKSRLNKISIG